METKDERMKLRFYTSRLHYEKTPVNHFFFNNKQLLQSDNAKYLGLHLDRWLTRYLHVKTKFKQLDLKYRQHY